MHPSKLFAFVFFSLKQAKNKCINKILNRNFLRNHLFIFSLEQIKGWLEIIYLTKWIQRLLFGLASNPTRWSERLVRTVPLHQLIYFVVWHGWILMSDSPCDFLGFFTWPIHTPSFFKRLTQWATQTSHAFFSFFVN